MCFQMASSVSQLGFGALADRWRPRVLLIAGPLLSVVVLSLVGLAPSTVALGVLLVLGGLGGAAFHPPAAAAVFLASGPNKGFAMAVHITGGSVGMAMAPLFFAPAIERLGLGWSPIIAVPGLVALWYLLRRVPPVRRGTGGGREGLSRARALRPAAHAPLLLGRAPHAHLGELLGVHAGAADLAGDVDRQRQPGRRRAICCVSGIGGFAGGPLADRFGPRR